MLGYWKFRNKIRNLFLGYKEVRLNNFEFKPESNGLKLFGNGYSLKDLDLNIIRNEDVFICNHFYKKEGFDSFRKINNILYFGLDNLQAKKATAKKLNQNLLEHLETGVFKKFGLGLSHVIPKDMITLVLEKYPNESIISSDYILEIIDSKLKVDKYNIGHTPQFMLLIGILMGYKKIDIYGLEHNYVKDILNKNPLCGTHFYGDTYRDVLESDRGKNLPREAYKITLSKLFEGNANIFRTYEQLAELATERGVEVIDHSNGSLFMFQDYSLWDLVEPKKD